MFIKTHLDDEDVRIDTFTATLHYITRLNDKKLSHYEPLESDFMDILEELSSAFHYHKLQLLKINLLQQAIHMTGNIRSHGK